MLFKKFQDEISPLLGSMATSKSYYLQIMLSASPSVRRMKKILQDYKTEDYLLLIGDPAAIGVACSIAAYFNRGRFNILKWDRQEGIYYPVEIDLHQKGELDD